MVSRTVPERIRKQLCEEVGFVCPVIMHYGGKRELCGSTFLTIHHFDPPWHEGHVHNPDGMIPLCNNHHPSADKNHWTKADLRYFKSEAKRRVQENGIKINSKFDWMIRKPAMVFGQNIFHGGSVFYGNHPLVWFNMYDGRFFLNINTLSYVERNDVLLMTSLMQDNVWAVKEGSKGLSIKCDHSLSRLNIEYESGNEIDIRFEPSTEQLNNTPAVRISYNVKETGISYLHGPLNFGKNNYLANTDCIVCENGLELGQIRSWEYNYHSEGEGFIKKQFINFDT